MNGAIPWLRQYLNGGLDDGGDVGNPAAPDANRDAGARLKVRGKAAVFELSLRLRTDVGEPEVR